MASIKKPGFKGAATVMVVIRRTGACVLNYLEVLIRLILIIKIKLQALSLPPGIWFQKTQDVTISIVTVETKPIVERKRRKSDLVVMWMSLWDLTVFLATEIWTALLGILEITNMFFNSEEVWEIRIWLKQYLDHVPDDFSQSWRDGILFCKLLNKLQPGCYPGVNKLDSNFGVRNLSQAFYILETQFDISPKITVEDIVTCRDGSNSKFLDLLLQLKRKKFDEEKEIKTSTVPNEIGKENSNESIESKNCIAKGTGLIVGLVGRVANFVVFFSSLSDLDLVVEIKGPCKSSCCERITKRSPKIKNTIKPWKPNSPHIFIRSPSNPEDQSLSIYENQKTKLETEKQYIPLEYEILSNKINFSYVPVTRGCHRIAILANGEHVTDSPYLVTVEPIIRIPTNDSTLPIKSALRPPSRQQSEEDQPKKQSVRFQEPEEKERKERLGKILKRKVLRYIVKIDGKDVVVDADSIGNLATSLLKMDYEFQKRPLCRRNSWGFVGDAERKVSFIRQFCIDLDELEAQSAKMQRSNSLSFTSTYKSPLKQRISYECEDILQHTILETVTEGATLDLNESTQVQRGDDDVFAYLSEDFDSHSKIKMEDNTYKQEQDDTNSSKNFESEASEDPLPTVDATKTNQFFPPGKIQIAHDPENKILAHFVGESGDHLPCASEDSCRLDTQTNESASSTLEKEIDTLESCSQKYSANLLMSFENNLEVDKSVNKQDVRKAKRKFAVADGSMENHFGTFGDVFIEEMPFTKTDVKTLNNHYSQRDIESSLIKIKENEGGNEKAKPTFTNESEKTGNSTNNPICNFCSCTKITTDPTVKNKHWKKEKYKSTNTSRYKMQNKKLVNAIVMKNRIMKQELQKYKLISFKIPSHYAFFYLKKHRKSFPDVKDINEKKYQYALQNFQCLNLLSKFGKNRSASEPTNFLHNDNQKQKDLDDGCMENIYNSQKLENQVDNVKHNESSNLFEAIRQNDSMSDSVDKTKLLKNESKKTFHQILSKSKIESKTLPLDQNNFQVYQPSKSINMGKKCFLPTYSSNALELNLKSSDESSEVSACRNPSYDFQIKAPTSVSIGEFTYKHFNPPFQIHKESPVKKQIKLWENSVAKESEKIVPKQVTSLHILPDLVNIKEKLKFWENVYQSSDDCDDKNVVQNTDISNREERDNVKSISSSNFEENLMDEIPNSFTKFNEKHFSNNDTGKIISLEKNISEKLMINSNSNKRRSFSDPCVLEQLDRDAKDNLLEHKNGTVNPASSKDEMSSSYDSNAIELFADDEDSSMELFCSTEDEYIDDEISENVSTYWGDLSVMKGLKVSDSSEYEEFLRLMNSECQQSCADECKFFGIATYFGHVAEKNRFWVLTKGAGRGNLSVSVQGIGQHNVAFVSVEYTQKDIYEITYQVFTPGLYLISVRWMDTPISGSPFLCKVTF